MTDSAESGGGWHGPPLCTRYLLVHFAAHQTQVLTGAAARSWTVIWALGAMSNGQPEGVGVWQQASDGGLNWRSVFADLAARGVERIRFAVQADAVAAKATFPDLTVLRTIGPEPSSLEAAPLQVVQKSMEVRGAGRGRRCEPCDPPRRVLQVARRVDRAAQLWQRGLRQAAARHGPFESGSAAASFVETWIATAELRQRRRRLAATRATALGIAAVAS